MLSTSRKVSADCTDRDEATIDQVPSAGFDLYDRTVRGAGFKGGGDLGFGEVLLSAQRGDRHPSFGLQRRLIITISNEMLFPKRRKCTVQESLITISAGGVSLKRTELTVQEVSSKRQAIIDNTLIARPAFAETSRVYAKPK